MLATPGIRKLICESRTNEIVANLEHGRAEGKQSMNQALADLVRRNIVTREEAMTKSSNPKELDELLL
jgi:twitching motility protein PilT